MRHSTSTSATGTKNDCQIQIHGWNSTGGFWCGPTEVAPEESDSDLIFRKLAKSTGPFHGTISCRDPGCPSFDFQTAAYDLLDSGLAVMHLDGVQAPIAALAIVPAHRRCRLRTKFAFGLVAHLSFLNGLITPDSELQILDYIENALHTDPLTLVFTLEGAHVSTDVSIVLATYLDKVATAMLRWLRMKDSEVPHRGPEGVERAIHLAARGARTPDVAVQAGGNHLLLYQDEHLAVDVDRQIATLDSAQMVLTRTEFALLAFLVRHAGEIIPHGALLLEVWGYRPGTCTRTLDVHVNHLRRKLGEHGDRYIETVFGIGHRFQPFDAVRTLQPQPLLAAGA